MKEEDYASKIDEIIVLDKFIPGIGVGKTEIIKSSRWNRELMKN